MLTNLFILLLSFLGVDTNAKDTKPAPNPKPGVEVPKPGSYNNEKAGEERGGWDRN